MTRGAVTHPLVIAAMLALACAPMPGGAHTFEQRWEPVRQLPPMQDRSVPEHPVHTFEERWEPVRRMPRMLNYLERSDEIRIVNVKTIPIRPEPPIAQGDAQPVPTPKPSLRSRRVTVYRPARLATDICARHGLRRVETGRSWRCRK